MEFFSRLLKNCWRNLLTKLLKLANLAKLWRPSHGVLTAKADQQLVYRLSPKTWPSLAQLKTLPRLLSKKEKTALRIIGGLIAVCVILLLGDFYFQRTVLVPKNGGSYTEGVVGVPKYINPLLSSYNDADRDLVGLIFNGLLKINKDGVLEPDLAASFQVSSDRKTYTFKIKDGITWHDGQPFTIDDVIFTVASIQDPEWQSQLRSALGNVQVEKLDETSVRFVLKEPVNNFLNSLTFGILPQHLWQAIPAANATLTELNKKPVGTGPFQFATLTKDKNGNIRTYTLKRHEHYFNRPPYLNELIFKFYGDFESAATALANKNIQGLSLVTKELQAKVGKNKNLNFYPLTLPQYTAVFFNLKKNKALEDVKVRQALAYGLDRQAILAGPLENKGLIVNGPILPGFLGYHPDIKKYPYELATAAKLLTEAGWLENASTSTAEKIRTKGKDVLQVTLTTVDKTEYAKIAELLQASWTALGVKTEIQIITKDRLRQEIIEPRNYQALLFGEIIKADPYPFWHSSMAQSPGANLAVWANREVDNLLEQARALEKPEEINQRYLAFQNLLAENVPAVFLYSPIQIYALDKKIKGVAPKGIILLSDRFKQTTDWYVKTKRDFSWKKPD